MAKIIRRTWTSDGPLGKKIRHVAFGYTEAAAYDALTQRLKDVEAGRIERDNTSTNA